MLNDTTILLVGHGSRGREGNRETINFAAAWREQHPDWRIEVCFIEHAEVLLDEGLDRAAEGAQRVIAIPFILNAAGHVKMELPHALEEARALKLDRAALETRADSDEMRAILKRQMDVARALAMEATPSFAVNGRGVGGWPGGAAMRR